MLYFFFHLQADGEQADKLVTAVISCNPVCRHAPPIVCCYRSVFFSLFLFSVKSRFVHFDFSVIIVVDFQIHLYWWHCQSKLITSLWSLPSIILSMNYPHIENIENTGTSFFSSIAIVILCFQFHTAINHVFSVLILSCKILQRWYFFSRVCHLLWCSSPDLYFSL